VGLAIFAGPARGEAAAQPSEPQATLSAQAASEVAQDQVTITLAVEVSAATQAQVSQALNQRLQDALKQAGHPAGVAVHNGAYRIWPMNDRDGKLSEWRGRAEILLQSQDFDAASRLAADLSPQMPVAGLSFSVSDARRAAEERKLLDEAVSAFKSRAQAFTQALGFDHYRLKSVDLEDSGMAPVSPGPRMMRAMVADATPVPLEGGRERVSVSVRGSIFLLPK
jgi:predicted secreted protein